MQDRRMEDKKNRNKHTVNKHSTPGFEFIPSPLALSKNVFSIKKNFSGHFLVQSIKQEGDPSFSSVS